MLCVVDVSFEALKSMVLIGGYGFVYAYFIVLCVPPTVFFTVSAKSNAVVDQNTFVTRVLRMISEKTVFETRLSITDTNRVAANDFHQGDRLPISPVVGNGCHGDLKWCVPRAYAFPSVQPEIAPYPRYYSAQPQAE
jgi:hypothetical protein